ncbi:MAG: hypothetical protein ACI9R3_004244 [Verrucomicrobiales bacterium]|jgi:hypothetical protein
MGLQTCLPPTPASQTSGLKSLYSYYDQVDPSTLGDDDIWVVSPDGFNTFAKFVGYHELAPGDLIADPALREQLGLFGPEGDVFFPWIRERAISAKYSLAAPDGDTWKNADNGSYSVLVGQNAVGLRDGGFVEHQLLGTFGVRVGGALPVQVEDWSVDVVDSADGCTAHVRLKFRSPTVVNWGEVMRDGERLFLRIEATSSPNGIRASSHAYPFGDLPGGAYLLETRVNDRLLSTTRFTKPDTPLEVPAETNVEIRQGPAAPLSANVTVRFLEPNWRVSFAGEIQRSGNRFFVNAKAGLATDVPDPEVWAMNYEIPQPEPGIYTFTFCLNGQVCDSARFEVAGPDGNIRVRNIDVVFTGQVACPDGVVAGDRPDDCFYDHTAAVTVTLSPHVAIVNWGKPTRLAGNRILIDIETAAVPEPGDVPNQNDGELGSDSHRYALGLLEKGDWTLVITSAGQRLARKEFVSPASGGLRAELRTTALDPAAERHQFHVIYSGPSMVNVKTLGDDEIRVINPRVHLMDFNGPVPECLSQLARLVGYQRTADGAAVDATYVIGCAEGWGQWLDPSDVFDGLEVHLVEGGVEMVNGLAARGRLLGRIPFPTHSFNLEAHADARPVHKLQAVSEVHVSYHSETPIDPNSLGDDDIAILSGVRIDPAGELQHLDEPIFAKLREFKPIEGGRHIEAIYILAPQGGWTSSWNGHYELTLMRGALSNNAGQVNTARNIGNLLVDIPPDVVRGSAKIAIRNEGGKVLADVTTKLLNHRIDNWGSPVLRGNTYYLDATAQASDAAAVIPQHHTYQLLPRGGDDESLDFEVLPGEAFGPAWFQNPLQIVVRNVEDWEALIGDNWNPLVDAGMPEPPVDFNSNMLVGVALGQQPLGFGVRISRVFIAVTGSLVVEYDTILPGPPPPDDEFVYPYQIISIPQVDLPVKFVENFVALPSPPPGEMIVAGQKEKDPLPGLIPPEPPVVLQVSYTVIFRVNGQVLARTLFHRPGEGGNNAKAAIEIVHDAAGVAADVHVEFMGYPYYQIADWGKVRRVGTTFYLPAVAERVEFIVDPGVIVQDHRYRLLRDGGGGGEPIPFEPLNLENWYAPEAKNLVIQTPDEWAAAWSGSVPIDSLPPEPPVDLGAHTLLGVLQGQQPNGCYAVNIVEVARDATGVVTVYYESTVPAPDQACPEVITHPQSFVVVPKIDGPVSFAEVQAVSVRDDAFRILPPPHELYEVYFLINETPYARTAFRWNVVPDPHPAFAVAIEAKGGRNSATIDVEITSPDGVISGIDWGEPAVDGHMVTANVSITVTPWGDLPNVDIATAEHTYQIADLPGGFHIFKLAINDRPAGRAYFLVRRLDRNPIPFEDWLAGLLAGIHGHANHGLAEAFGDLDGDGTGDMEEFYLGTNPLSWDVPKIRPEWVRRGDNNEAASLAIFFQRRRDVGSITAAVEASADLRQWDGSQELFDQVSVTDLGNGLEEVVICLKDTIGESPFRFLRLRMIEDPVE